MEGGNAIVLKAVKEICDRLDSLVGNTYLLSLLLTRGETGRVEYYLIEVNSGKELTEMDVDVKDLKDFKRFVEEKQAGHLVEGIRMSKIDVRIMREIFESICQSKMVMEVEPATINCWL